MASPVSIGDFIALADQAHKLYINVYKVARAAPDQLRGLDKELASLSQSITLLVDEIENPQSVINVAGPDRAQMLQQLKDHTQETLSSLEKLAEKHKLAKDPLGQLNKVKRGWKRVMFAKDAGAIDALRSKLVYHYSVIQLLLTSAGNSSLERMHSEQIRMTEMIREIKGLVLAPDQLDVGDANSGMADDKEQSATSTPTAKLREAVVRDIARSWTDYKGRFSTEATFQGLKNDRVQLLKTNGVLISVRLCHLSDPDIAWVEKATNQCHDQQSIAKKRLLHSMEMPSVSSVDVPRLPSDMISILKAKAEDQGSWVLTGLDAWIQVGRWWLMKAQWGLAKASSGSMIGAQDYLNFIKASWILVDIISVHPQRDFVLGGWQQREIVDLSESVEAELKRLADLKVLYPLSQDILMADATIWTITPTTIIKPNQHNVYQLSEGELSIRQDTQIVFQSFGRLCRPSGHRVYCMIILAINCEEPAATLFCQCPQGSNIVMLDIFKTPFDLRLTNGSFQTQVCPMNNFARKRINKVSAEFELEERSDVEKLAKLLFGFALVYDLIDIPKLHARCPESITPLAELLISCWWIEVHSRHYQLDIPRTETQQADNCEREDISSRQDNGGNCNTVTAISQPLKAQRSDLLDTIALLGQRCKLAIDEYRNVVGLSTPIWTDFTCPDLTGLMSLLSEICQDSLDLAPHLLQELFCIRASPYWFTAIRFEASADDIQDWIAWMTKNEQPLPDPPPPAYTHGGRTR